MIYKTDEKVYDATGNMQCDHCGERFGMHNPDTLECKDVPEETTRICVSFKSKRQLPLIMVVREHVQNKNVVWATVLFDTMMLRERGCWRIWFATLRGKLRRLALFILSKLRA